MVRCPTGTRPRGGAAAVEMLHLRAETQTAQTTICFDDHLRRVRLFLSRFTRAAVIAVGRRESC